jgi:hypothetical protein
MLTFLDRLSLDDRIGEKDTWNLGLAKPVIKFRHILLEADYLLSNVGSYGQPYEGSGATMGLAKTRFSEDV